MSDFDYERFIREVCDEIAEIHKLVGEPWGFEPEHGQPIKNYTIDDVYYFDKHTRNVAFIQRLYKTKDEIVNSIYLIQLLSDKITFSSDTEGIDTKFLKHASQGYLSTSVSRAVKNYLNGLSYFFDLPSKDSIFDVEEIVNYLYIRDEYLVQSIAKLLQEDDYVYIEELNNKLDKGFAGLTVIKQGEKSTERQISNSEGSFSKEELVRNSMELLRKFLKSLADLRAQIQSKYAKSLGYDSINDIVFREENGQYRHHPRENIQPDIFKIYNLWSESTNFEVDNFIIRKNFLYENAKNKTHRLQDKEVTSLQLGKETKKETTKITAQEGTHAWTYAFQLKSKTENEQVTVVNSCLILSFLTGYGVYSDYDVLSYSHKAKASIRLERFEVSETFSRTYSVINKLNSEDKELILKVLSRYRQAIQPAASNIQFVRLWEILEILSDYYCKVKSKPIPENYKNEDELRETLKAKLDNIEEEIEIPLKNYVTIQTKQSVMDKIERLTEKFNVSHELGVESQKIKQALQVTYSFRNKLSHSSETDFRHKQTYNELVNYYLFISELLFFILLQILSLEPTHSKEQLKSSLSSFILDKERNSYIKRHNEIQQQQENIEEVFEILAGEKPWPKNTKELYF